VKNAARLLLVAFAAGLQAGARLQLLPAGEFRTIDGRGPFLLDAQAAQAIVADVRARQNRLVIDYEHQTLFAERNGQPAPAAGWFSQVEWVEGEGLYATDVQWTDRARALIEAGEYAYFSPVLTFDPKTRRPSRLMHGGITNTAAIDGMHPLALAANEAAARYAPEETPDVNPLLARLIAALGLAADTTEDQAAAALLALKARADAPVDPAQYVPVETFRATQAEVATLAARLNAQEVNDLVAPALADGRLLPAQEGWARELGKSNVAALKSYLETAQPIAALKGTQTGGKPPKSDRADGEHGLTAEQLVICKTMNIDPKDYAAQRA
jgi:phage I-like protein